MFQRILMIWTLCSILVFAAGPLHARVEEMPSGSNLSTELNETVYPGEYSSLSFEDQKRSWHAIAAINNAMAEMDSSNGNSADLTEISNVHEVYAGDNYYYPSFSELQSIVSQLAASGIDDISDLSSLSDSQRQQLESIINDAAQQHLSSYQNEMAQSQAEEPPNPEAVDENGGDLDSEISGT